MKRRALLIVVAVIFAATAAGLFWRAPLMAALGFSTGSDRYLGYVEGETSLIAPPVSGRLVQRPVDRGVQVRKGDRLFVIDPVVAQAEVARAEGALAEARARYENLLKGKRPEEKEITTAQRRETEAALAMAEIEYKRQSELLAKGVGTRKDYENADSTLRQLRMRQSSLIAQEKVNELAARPDEIAAAKAQADQDQAALDQARKRLDDLMPGAPEDGLIENTFFNVGEWVPAGAPVVSLLPPFRLKLRFFVPQEDVALLQMGQTVSFTCDSCPPDLKARIIYISPRTEFTPPVIYSQTARTKLVFLIEARPDPTGTRLSPGLPITVAPVTR
ncbi:MAG: HlyD family secretion protein [Reyranella sp.]|uniref:HlyD family secretion protein n=1 Tax=Reyranella sp. TaxID=1929291 RepID=UPI001AD2C050|nr:HlyD family efflux transporter periplasmic adaptor subunit [Reyranella sp.]MBN9090702.1 HlyD family secretion protein [Reyranella sp.]